MEDNGRVAVGAIIGVAAVLCAASAEAQPIDPYAASATQAYRREEAHFRAFAREVYFAQACKVFLDPVMGQMLVGQQGSILLNEALQDRIRPTPGPELLREAASRGAALAAKPGGCAFWHEHLDEVHRLRQMGSAVEASR